MTKVTLPTPESNPGVAEWSEVYANDRALREVVNGGIDSENIKKESLEDLSLKSPNNAAYRDVISATGLTSKELAAGTYFCTDAQVFAPTGAATLVSFPAAPRGYLHVLSADYSVSAKTTKLRLRLNLLTNGTKPESEWTAGLYPVTLSGAANELKLALGAVVTGSTAKLAAPAINESNVATGSDFTIPSDGLYILGFVTNAKLAVNAAAFLRLSLQQRWT